MTGSGLRHFSHSRTTAESYALSPNGRFDAGSGSSRDFSAFMSDALPGAAKTRSDVLVRPLRREFSSSVCPGFCQWLRCRPFFTVRRTVHLDDRAVDAVFVMRTGDRCQVAEDALPYAALCPMVIAVVHRGGWSVVGRAILPATT